MKRSTHTTIVKYLAMVLAATGLGSPAFGQEYNFFGVSDMGNNIVVSGKFIGADVDGDTVLEWPNVPLEMTLLDLTATHMTGGGSQVSYGFGLSSLNDFGFQMIGNSGLWGMDAEIHTAELVNGNEVSADATLAVVNSGNTLSNRFAADLKSTNGPDSIHGIGSGPIMITEKLSGPGSKINFGFTFADNSSPLGGGTLLGSFTIDDLDDFNIDKLSTDRTEISSSVAMFVDQRGQVSRWEFEQGFANPPIPGSTGDVEVHYQCGSPDITCWGSVDDFIDLVAGMDSNDGPLDITGQAAMEVMQGTVMFDLPIESAFFEVAEVVPRYPGDFDADDDADGSDFLVLQRNMGLVGDATRWQGDANGDHDINELDTLLWQGDFGNPMAPTFQIATAVPEPSAWLLSCLAGALALRLRYGRRGWMISW